MSANLTPTLPDKTPGGYVVRGNLEELLDAVAAKLQTLPLIVSKGVRVLPQSHGDLYNQLNQVLNSKLSLLLVVGFEGVDSRAKSLMPQFKDVGIVVLCYEAVTFNQAATGTKVSGLTFAELCAGALHQKLLVPLPTDLPLLSMREEDTIGLDEQRSKPEKGALCWRVRFSTDACPKASLQTAQ